jgi:hypothetical protein
MYNLGEVFEQIKGKPVQQPKEVHIDLSNSFTINIESFLKKFKELDTMSDNELYQLAKATYPMVLESTVANKDTGLAITLFNNARYVTALINVFNSVTLTYSQRVYCNKLAYDYLRAKGQKDAMIVQLLQNLANTVNIDILPNLLGAGLDRQLSTLISIARYSSTDEYVTVKRVNRIIFDTSSAALMTEDRIIQIYQVLYWNCMTKLFKGIMYDAYPKELLDASSDDSNEIYSTINLAVLTMLNTMTSKDIRSILKSYYDDYINFPCQPRFKMKLSEDYYRINEIIYQLESEGVYIP